MYHEVNLCRNCRKEIPLGTYYISISRNVERYYHDKYTEDLEPEAYDSFEICKLCENCAKHIKDEEIAEFIGKIKIPGQEINN